MEIHKKNEILTGVFYVNPEAPTFLELLNMTETPLAQLPESALRPPQSVLDTVMEEYR